MIPPPVIQPRRGAVFSDVIPDILEVLMRTADTTARRPQARWATRTTEGGREQIVMRWQVSTRPRPSGHRPSGGAGQDRNVPW